MLEPAAFDTVTSGIQHIVTTIGIIAAGAWALYTFRGQHVAQRAQLEIRRIEQDSLEQPILRTTISLSPTIDDSYPSTITVTIKNDGKRALTFFDTTVSLVPIPKHESHQSHRSRTIRVSAQFIGDDGKFVDMPPRILRSGQDRNLVFVLQRLETGLYFVELKTGYSGLRIVDGHFEPADDVPIRAVDQTILCISNKTGSGK